MPQQVLIIDDAVHIRRLIARMLNQHNFSTLEAADGLEGLRLLREQKPDVVTCDISMPLMDGFEFLLAAKNDPEIEHVPIVIITAVGQEEETTRALELGADACLTKPFSSSHLLETIQIQLDKRSPIG
ncbi:MAG: response regulator [Anaerolineae bacterium]|nr:response regulator [Anaerolineae bacterium]